MIHYQRRPIERDIDGDRAETAALENKEPRFGQVGAARRIARTIFLGSAPSSVASKVTARGLDRARGRRCRRLADLHVDDATARRLDARRRRHHVHDHERGNIAAR